MAGFTLVHGAWHGGRPWKPLRAELEAGHSPMLTHPRELADILESAAREAGVV